MVCRYCGKEMIKDDCDYNFKGNYNNYWICEHCNAFCFELIRFGKMYKRTWKKGENIK